VVEKMDRSVASKHTWIPIIADLMIDIRYGEILLIAAEASFELGNRPQNRLAGLTTACGEYKTASHNKPRSNPPRALGRTCI